MHLVNPSSLNDFYGKNKPQCLRRRNKHEANERELKQDVMCASCCHERNGKG